MGLLSRNSVTLLPSLQYHFALRVSTARPFAPAMPDLWQMDVASTGHISTAWTLTAKTMATNHTLPRSTVQNHSALQAP